jgi:predicted nucleic acid-binding protein
MIVVDTNIISYFYLGGEFPDLAERAFQKDPHWMAPFLWRSELRSILILCVRKKIITYEDAAQILNVLHLASQSGCSVYDCEFVALAQDLQVPLVTMDKKVLKEFPETVTGLTEFK